jgi:hypothetical protein
VCEASKVHVSSLRGASKVGGVSPHQRPCHVIKPSNGALVASKPIIIITQTLTLDIIIKELNAQGGMAMHHLSE